MLPARTRQSAPSKNGPPRGIRFGKYELLKKIAAGGVSNLYLAKSLRGDGSLMTLKLLSKDMSKEVRLQHLIAEEAKLASRIRHPNLCRVYDYGHDRGRIFVAREHLDGLTFAEILHTLKRNRTRLKIEHALALFVQACQGVAAVRRHCPGVSHCDISPDNFMVTTDGIVKLLDIGGFTAAGMRAKGQAPRPQSGWQHASPERARGEKLDSRSEVFSLATLLFEMLTGRSLFARPTEMASHLAALHDEIPCISTQRDLPRAIVDLVNKALYRDPQKRFAGVSEFVCALQAASRVPSLPGVPILSRFIHNVRQLPLSPSQAQIGRRRMYEPSPASRRFALPPPKLVVLAPALPCQHGRATSATPVKRSRGRTTLFEDFEKRNARFDVRNKTRGRSVALALTALLCMLTLAQVVT